MPDELLEEVRLLANIETATDKLLPIVLAGQPELADRLNQVSLRQLKQRVALRCLLLALDAKETAEYIAGRIRVAGGNSVMVFTRQAVDPIYDRSGGIPRLISVICDNALISGVCRRSPAGRPRHRRGRVPRFRSRAARAPAPPRRRTRSPRPASQPAAGARRRRRRSPPRPAAGAPPEPPKKQTFARSLFEHFSIRRRFSIVLTASGARAQAE